jgi:ferrous iron transport protein A
MKNKKILLLVHQGKKVKIIGFERRGAYFQRRLQEMGLLPGKIIEVVRNTNTGPVEINVMGSNLAIGRGIASKILVEEIDE